MKLELLVVLAVAALVPSLSEGRLLSKCELKTKLAEAADQFNLTVKIAAKGVELDEVLAKIICSLDLKSGLNTSLVTNLVLRKPILHKPKRRPISRRPVRLFGRKRPGRDVESKEDGVSSEGEEDNPRPTGKPGGMSRRPTGKPGGLKPKPTGKTEGVSTRSERPEGKRPRPGKHVRGRDKREAEESAGDEEKHDKVEAQESKAAEDEEFGGYEEEGDEDEVDEDELDEEDLEELEAELDDQEREQPKEGEGSRRKRHVPKQFRSPGHSRKPPPRKPMRKPFRPFKPIKTLSFSFFGLFQLSNRLACISSNNTRSLNLCKTECSSFVDDDISDDIDCFVKSRAWMKALRFPWKCARLQVSEYFECDQPLNSTMSTLQTTT
ncbi:nucleoplasmin-like protein ANO39 [Coregonus clupeaformis]|uniref:nucleoplasmin-like protein ANO39 n=1 Tax=Coregonus clupeaformis TaxID=59861 RepID=UPI001E1C7F93|nr:nucleoplasmin-like protein ANO39 [Coregonus clupeaformis]